MVPLQKRRGWDEMEGWINHTELFSRTLSGLRSWQGQGKGQEGWWRKPGQEAQTAISNSSEQRLKRLKKVTAKRITRILWRWELHDNSIS